MKLVVLGKPHIESLDSTQQNILVSYDPIKEITTIDCDVDIVTLGIAVNVLNEQFGAYLSSLSTTLAKEIEEVTRKAVATYEENRSKSSQSRSYYGC